MDYITNEDTIIFGPSFNQELNPTLLINYKQIIFSDYELDPINSFDIYEKFHAYRYYECFKNNKSFDKFKKLKYIGSKFNRSVDALSFSGSLITHLIFDEYSNFNQPVDVLPLTLTHLTFSHEFNITFNFSMMLIVIMLTPNS